MEIVLYAIGGAVIGIVIRAAYDWLTIKIAAATEEKDRDRREFEYWKSQRRTNGKG